MQTHPNPDIIGRQPAVLLENGQAVTTSQDIARTFSKRHEHVLDAIRKLLAQLPSQGIPNFRETLETNQQNGQSYPCYHLTRDGFTLLAMGFTGKAALRFKLEYLEAFNTMEAYIKGQNLPPKPSPAFDAESAYLLERERIKLFTTAVTNNARMDALKDQVIELLDFKLKTLMKQVGEKA